jgi:selenocysteine-specific elongation factor
MRRLILGTAGHIDHGKTALVHALTGTDTDRLPEEKRRGITIDLGFAHLALPSGAAVAIIDVPGHEAFVRNMLAGATGIDFGLLVIAADEGVMPQTLEHLAILELLGVRSLVVALTKSDLVEADWLGLVTEEVRETIARGPFARAPLVATSATTGQGLDTLVAALDVAAAAISPRDPADFFRMPIDRVFTVQGTGTVVTGTIWSGRARRDQPLRLVPGGRDVRIRALQVHGQVRDEVGPGERAALALAGVPRDATRRGDTLVSGSGWAAASMLTVRLAVLPGSGPVRTRRRVRFHLGTGEVLGRVVVLDGPEIAAGDEGWAQLRLEEPVVARALDRFVLRAYSPVVTIAGGTVIEPQAPKRRRLTPADAAMLASLAEDPVDAVLRTTLTASGWAGVDPTTLAVRLGRPEAAILNAIDQALERGAAVRTGGRLFDASIQGDARSLILGAVERVHRDHPLRPGADRVELRRALPPWSSADLAESAIAGLIADGTLVTTGSALRKVDYVTRLTEDQQGALDEIIAAFASAGLAPPTPAELPPNLGRRPDLGELLRILEADGRLVPLRPDLYVHPPSLAAAVTDLRARLGGRDTLTPADFRDLFGITRKHLIPLLEHLDRAGVTTRHGDARSVNPP